MFDKILIANRGEIACRVIKSARKMGIKTVAVYSEADKEALHVEMADEAVCIGPAASNQSYLVMENIIKAIKDTGAQAVHPGYGFLSENPAFFDALAEIGVEFIGPETLAIKAMGDKIESKLLAQKAGVSTVPGYTEVIKDTDHAVEIAGKIGYPVMLKASAGGGGKGMRVAYDEAECRDGFERATSEAVSSFGDDRVFIEKFIEEPRHIEIQILADTHGNTLYLNERECSIQRRHQKVIEEAPSPFLTPETRKNMGEEAVALAKAVNYRSAGTVEFIVDKDQNFYFLEMNTRLQVEHPVTELITGIDLVEEMIKVADGQELSIKQDDIGINGWSMESRVYAEDPFRGFLPSTGRLIKYRPPVESDTVRVDTGVYEGGEISMFYDPMIAKLITWGKDRAECTENMKRALDEYYIRGVGHNISFLNAVMSKQRFIDGTMTTNFIAEEYPDGFDASMVPQKDPKNLVAVACFMKRMEAEREVMISGQMEGGYGRQLNDEWVVQYNDEKFEATVTPNPTDGYDVDISGTMLHIRSEWTFGEPLFFADINGTEICVQIDALPVGYSLFHAGAQATVKVLTKRQAELNDLMPYKAPPDMSAFLLSPMPGLLLSVAVEEGQEVKAGEELCVIEAMKMENIMRAEKDVIIKKIHASAGGSLSVDEKIIEFESDD
ncbi:Propionyl-CoA carboxylase alpha chain, biotin-carrying subunit [Candidatus Terasakiella magnetica]|uniref:propionyl-CoA carboxylase n=1 Tax=Candidatus Terasakiella magnetica TaxID=1867952 RepID=A0A1C3RDC9_9PROT|nr:acetyl/propionyl/methylcrotonyl-CoA carboxylase subunit alpha [Candidatus Terasakiella magnetica]SCA55265.1 Propionyl-CoA carboxylase alpha chain, biotin-carrying subunit [Candidatus Terasakiella magnetica]